jgi:hypothetical protein
MDCSWDKLSLISDFLQDIAARRRSFLAASIQMQFARVENSIGVRGDDGFGRIPAFRRSRRNGKNAQIAVVHR